jgi:competence protein ComEC
MNGKAVYFSFVSLLAVLSSTHSFLLFFFLTLLYLFFLFKIKHFSFLQLLIFLSVFLLFYTSSQMKMSTNKTKITDSQTEFYIRFSYDPKIDGDLLQVIGNELRFKEKIILRYQIQSKEEKESLGNKNFYGYICKTKGELKKPKQAKNENAFNYQKYLEKRGIFWILNTKQVDFENCIVEKVNVHLLLKKIRFQGIKYLENHFPPEISSLSSALIFGDRSLLEPEMLSNYQRVGIIHLLAISGLHVSLFIGMLYFIGLRLGATRDFMIKFLLVLLPIYAMLTGGSPSVIRAVLMIFLVMATIKWRNIIKMEPIDTISLALMIFLLINPLIVLDVGFQLSFSVTFAIVNSAPIILRKVKSNLSKMIVTSLIAQFSSLPFLLFHFYGSSLISIIANLIFIPFFSFFLLPGVYLLFLFQLVFGMIPSWIMKWFIKFIHLSNDVSGWLSHLSFAEWIPGRPSPIFLIMYSIVIISIFVFWERKHSTKQMIILIFLSCFLFSFQLIWNRVSPVGEVTMIDVGQGDSILIHLPYHQGNYLIDTGGSMQFEEEQWQKQKKIYDVGKDVVVPYLKSKGITRIDKLILTHGDMDHIGGSFAVLDELDVNQIVMPFVKEPSDMEQAIVKDAKKKRIPVIKVSEGDFWKNNAGVFTVLSPEKNFFGERNRGSVTIYAQMGGLTWFFGGDLDQEGEERIIKKYSNLTFDVLKVGHHGSKTSSLEEFLDQGNPKISLVSVGEKNRYGHPNDEVIKKLNRIHSTIYRTDKQGGITYRFYLNKGTISSFLP